MLSLRRSTHEPRIEIMPLIDVIFLLLTFFIYAMVLMVRADLVPMELPSFDAGSPAEPAPAITISIDAAGDLFLDRDPVNLTDLPARLLTAVEQQPDTIVYIAADAQGDEDRLPVFLELYDQLAREGLDIRLVGAPKEPAAAAPE